MANHENSYTGSQGSGTGNAFFDFTFPTYTTSEVRVEVDNVVKTLTTHYTVTNYNTTSGGKVRFTTGNIPTGTTPVRIFRQTDVDNPKATFTAGSALKAGEINDNFKQLRHALQEAIGANTTNRKIQPFNIEDGAITSAAIKDLTVARGDIENDAIDGTKIADDSVDSEHFVADSIDTEHYAPGSIDATAIGTDAVTRDKIFADAIDSTKIADSAINSEHYVDGSIDHEHLAHDIIDGDNIQDDVINSEHYVADSIDTEHYAPGSVDNTALGPDAVDGAKLADNSVNSEHYVDGSIDHVHLSNDAVDGDNIANDSIDSEHYVDLSIDTQHIGNLQVTTGKIADGAITDAKIQGGSLDNRYYTETELDAGQLDNRYFTETELTNGALDGRYFTETEADARYFNVSTGDTIKDGDTFPDNDTTIATTAAINDRIIDLVDDVGGFVPIANETSFPTANPDVNNGTGTLVSIKAIGSTRTPSSGTVTIANGAGTGNTVTITGCGSTVLTAGFGVIVETTGTLHTYSFHRLVPKATEVTTVASISGNVTTVATNIANINTVAADLNEGTSEIDTVATNIANVNNVGNSITNVDTTAGSIANVNTTATNIGNVNNVGNNIASVNTTAGSIANVNTAAANITNINTFANRYRIASSAPTSSLDEGDLYFDTTQDELRVYNGSTWQGGVTATGNLLLRSGGQMTGNITMSGSQTVDGRDLSVDGSKLDGIESGATADQTSSDIKTLLASDKLTGTHLATNSVSSTQIANDSITANELANNSVGNSHIIDGTIANAEISGSAAIAGTKISPDFGSQNIATTGNITTTGKVLFANVYTNESDLPSASTYHGMFAHVHSTGLAYYAHGGNWIKLAKLDAPDFTGGIDVTGNITVTGSVDGVDISAFNTQAQSFFNNNGNGVLANGVTATTQSASDNSTKVATTAYTDTAIANLVDSSPSALNTLNELAAAIGDDANFSTTITNSIATKLPLAGGTLTGNLIISSTHPKFKLVDTDHNSDFEIMNNHGNLLIYDSTNGTSPFNIDSSGNIQVSGTVDGRDLATDGTKLDGIASSANNYSHPNHSGEVTSSGDGAMTIADNVVDEANLKVSNSPTNGYFLSAQSGNTGGLTWAQVTTDLVGDTTPQLGGDLDTNGNDISFHNDHKVKFGNDNDMQIYHSNSGDRNVINSNKKFEIYANGDLELKKNTGELYFKGVHSTGVTELYYNNNKKLETSNTGVTVTGTVAATAYTGDGSALSGVASAVADGCIYENSQTISNNYTITTNKNALSAGPITIANGAALTIPNGSVYTIV